MNRNLVDKADKSSTDSNFLVQQNEVDNLKVKLQFYQDKND